MTTGETLLKITDYPFAYSFVFILGGILGFSLTQNKFYLLGIAGTLGTFLTIIDPMGGYVRYRLEQRMSKTKVESETEPNYEHQKSAIGSRAIGVEIDKIVALIYFAITLALFVIGMAIPMSELADNFVIVGKHQEIICNSFCIKGYSVGGSLSVAFILSEVGRRRWSELDKKLKTAGMHQRAIENEYATQNSVENMTSAIDQGDWTTADKWASKIKEEIKYKKGKRDIVIKSAETVYLPLTLEFSRIKTTIDTFPARRIYPTINFGAWLAIKERLGHLVVDDPKFRERMDNFQSKTRQYDELFDRNRQKIEDIINKIASRIYNKNNVIGVGYFVGTQGETFATPLSNCVFCNIHPKDIEPTRKPYSIQIDWIENTTQQRENMASQEQIDKFNNAWDEIKKEAENDPDVKKMRELFEEIKKENLELLKIATEKFELQYKV